MIFRDFTTTGDGIVSALQILRIMRRNRKAAQRTEKRASANIRRRSAI